ncbi:hypothetical protein [Bremerella sp. P1]|uniref:hypothetical protein n=1 Tax=Bremerella sp. P1 TaxID=3026424 RepID=UPI002368B256|nr:hypothetical protein [Bremerella sp. P1]WDI44664.1 hypothetical protein PSR63_12030 [Bremerella sp. P1]
MPHDDSPFRSPSIESTQPAVDEDTRLIRIVWYQRLTILAILVYTGFAIGPMLLTVAGLWVPIRAVSIAYWCFVFVAMFTTFRLAQQVYSTLIAVLCGLLILFPIVGLVVLVVVNQKALSDLNEHGLQPGFLGMSRSEAARRLNSQRADQP